ncbi:MAG: DUF6544 family protein [Syntrophomonadaceae bacterium]
MLKTILIILSVVLVVILLIFIVSFIANLAFNQQVEKEVKELFGVGKVKTNEQIVQEKDLEGLPEPVQRWLRYSQVVGKDRITTVRSKQSALLRTKQDQPWMATEAENYYTIPQPGFIWHAKIKAAPLVHIAGRDKYYQGNGNMLIKFLSLFTVANAKGKEINQGSLIRYLAESVWFPTAALNSYIIWEEIDSNSAQATISYKGITAAGTFFFNEKGEPINFIAERYMESNGEYSLETWSVLVGDYKEFSGFKVPTTGEVTWKLKTGDFKWFQFELKEIEYNTPIAY